MLKNLCWLLLGLTVGAQAADLAPQPDHQRALRVSAALLGHYHYKPALLDDEFSAAVFDRYLKTLDGDKYYFVQSDIDALGEYRTRLDDAIRDEDLAPAFAIFNLYTRRATERFTYARSLLKDGFRFDQDERFEFRRDKAPWAPSEEALRDVWRKRVKNDWLRLKLAGKPPADIAALLDKRYEQSLRRVTRLKSDDAFLFFMNAYTSAIEPHTSYLGPRGSADFDISMRLSLFGIGAVLQEKDDYTVIREITPGGPAARSGQLKAGDRIVAVAQGEKGPFVDVIGSRLDDTVALIRGPADTTVRLDILPANAGPDAKPRQITLVRKKIDLAQQAAKKSIQEVTDGNTIRRIGVITLPTFYDDFEARRKGDPNFRSATRDVARLLGELGKEQVDGVILDLRHNGGGSLKEAIELTGLFIDTGPVVMERNAQGRVFVDGDSTPGTAWDGPLGVLIDGESASASEIFAAAMQDYGRGIIIGERSYGKGTVQSVLNLDEAVGNKKPALGELRMTVAQFFRINGSTTQLRGVQPDIPLPAANDPSLTGEASNDNALPWTRIRAAAYDRVADKSEVIPVLLARHTERAANDPEFQQLAGVAAELQRLRSETSLSLNETERQRDNAALEKKLAGLSRGDDGLLEGERDLAADKSAEKAAAKEKDVRLLAAARIIADEAALARNKEAVAKAAAGTQAANLR
ncbi:MAG: carboxy terminal-processing peptidase [Dechloromonas sp.]|nr:carboxy terminal-processing peptidase [Dechloromonas sp.]